MRGVVRCLGLPAETRKHAVNDWTRWSEKHGLPLVELRVPASKAESDETEEWFAQMQDLASDTTIVSPQGEGDAASYGVNLIEAKDTAWEGFKELIGRQDGDVSIAVEGQNLSTENSSVGAKASSQTGHSIRQDLREADAAAGASLVAASRATARSAVTPSSATSRAALRPPFRGETVLDIAHRLVVAPKE